MNDQDDKPAPPPETTADMLAAIRNKLSRRADDVDEPTMELRIAEYYASRKRTGGADGGEKPTGDEPTLTADAEVESALAAAITADEILYHLSRLCWLYRTRLRFPLTKFPEDQAMTPRELTEWLPQLPRVAVGVLWPAIIAEHAGNQARAGEPVSTPQDDPDIESALPGAIELIHRQKGDVEIVHLLFSVVLAWQERVTERKPFPPRRRGSLPRLTALNRDPVFLGSDFPIGLDAPAEPSGQLPSFTDTVGCTSWLLWLFDRAGGERMAAGHGAPWDMRLWVYAMLHLKVEDRDGLWHTLRFPTEEVIGWLHPNCWSNQRRDWEKLPAALETMLKRLTYVPVPGIGKVAMLFPSVIPTVSSDPLVEFTIRVPPTAAHGDRIEFPLLIAYGAESSLLFRAYLAVTASLGRSARGGHPITRQIAVPVLGPDGKPRRKKGRIVRSDTHRIPNPVVRYVKRNLTEHDLARSLGFEQTDRRRRHEARFAFERMDADGVIDLQRDGRRFAIFGATRDQQLRRKSAAAAAELLRQIAGKLPEGLTRAKLVDRAAGAERRAVVHALRDVSRDEPVNAATLEAAARNLEFISN